jgi:hypothetical protein
VAIRLKKGQLSSNWPRANLLPRLTVAVVLTQISFVVVYVALVFVAIFAVVLHITAVAINVALVVIAIHAVVVKVLPQALTIPAILSTFAELSLVPRYIAVVCISISTIFAQIAPVVLDVTPVAISVAPVLVEIVVVRLLICGFNCGSLRCRTQCEHTCDCNSDKTMSDDSFDCHVVPPCSSTLLYPQLVKHLVPKKVLADLEAWPESHSPNLRYYLDTLLAWHSSPCRWRAGVRLRLSRMGIRIEVPMALGHSPSSRTKD